MSSELEITLENKLSEVAIVLDAIDAFFDRISLEGAARFDVALALEEAVSNVIRYAYPQGETHTIQLKIAKQDGSVHCTLVDSGRPFDPLAADEVDIDADLEDRGVGGLGIHFVKQSMQTVTYNRINGQNVLKMTRAFEANPQ